MQKTGNDHVDARTVFGKLFLQEKARSPMVERAVSGAKRIRFVSLLCIYCVVSFTQMVASAS